MATNRPQEWGYGLLGSLTVGVVAGFASGSMPVFIGTTVVLIILMSLGNGSSSTTTKGKQ